MSSACCFMVFTWWYIDSGRLVTGHWERSFLLPPPSCICSSGTAVATSSSSTASGCRVEMNLDPVSYIFLFFHPVNSTHFRSSQQDSVFPIFVLWRLSLNPVHADPVKPPYLCVCDESSLMINYRQHKGTWYIKFHKDNSAMRYVDNCIFLTSVLVNIYDGIHLQKNTLVWKSTCKMCTNVTRIWFGSCDLPLVALMML